MPSMSYCMFENTSDELYECVDKMKEASVLSDLDMNEYEVHGYASLYKLCKQFIVEHDRIKENTNDED